MNAKVYTCMIMFDAILLGMVRCTCETASSALSIPSAALTSKSPSADPSSANLRRYFPEPPEVPELASTYVKPCLWFLAQDHFREFTRDTASECDTAVTLDAKTTEARSMHVPEEAELQ